MICDGQLSGHLLSDGGLMAYYLIISSVMAYNLIHLLSDGLLHDDLLSEELPGYLSDDCYCEFLTVIYMKIYFNFALGCINFILQANIRKVFFLNHQIYI